MSELSKRLKANRGLDGKPCRGCTRALAFGDDVAICGACAAEHHAPCWDRKGGCANDGCANAPLPQIAPPTGMPAADGGAVAPGHVRCPHCGRTYLQSRKICPACRRAPNESGIYTGPRRNAPGAVASLVWGILSLLICGFVLGFFALSNAGKARTAMKHDPTLEGEGFCKAGTILGWIGIAGHALLFMLRLAS